MDEFDKFYVVRNESLFVLGIGEGEMFVVSDVFVFFEYINKVIFLDDGEYVILIKDFYVVKRIDIGEVVEKFVYEISWMLEMVEKVGYFYFMLKEIYE